jgi:hypothetical protein
MPVLMGRGALPASVMGRGPAGISHSFRQQQQQWQHVISLEFGLLKHRLREALLLTHWIHIIKYVGRSATASKAGYLRVGTNRRLGSPLAPAVPCSKSQVLLLLISGWPLIDNVVMSYKRAVPPLAVGWSHTSPSPPLTAARRQNRPLLPDLRMA